MHKMGFRTLLEKNTNLSQFNIEIKNYQNILKSWNEIKKEIKNYDLIFKLNKFNLHKTVVLHAERVIYTNSVESIEEYIDPDNILQIYYDSMIALVGEDKLKQDYFLNKKYFPKKKEPIYDSRVKTWIDDFTATYYCKENDKLFLQYAVKYQEDRKVPNISKRLQYKVFALSYTQSLFSGFYTSTITVDLNAIYYYKENHMNSELSQIYFEALLLHYNRVKSNMTERETIAILYKDYKIDVKVENLERLKYRRLLYKSVGFYEYEQECVTSIIHLLKLKTEDTKPYLSEYIKNILQFKNNYPDYNFTGDILFIVRIAIKLKIIKMIQTSNMIIIIIEYDENKKFEVEVNQTDDLLYLFYKYDLSSLDQLALIRYSHFCKTKLKFYKETDEKFYYLLAKRIMHITNLDSSEEEFKAKLIKINHNRNKNDIYSSIEYVTPFSNFLEYSKKFLNKSQNMKKLVYIVPFYFTLLVKCCSYDWFKKQSRLTDHIIDMSSSIVGEIVFPLIYNQVSFFNNEHSNSITELIFRVYLNNTDKFVTSLAYLKVLEDSIRNTCFSDVCRKLREGNHWVELTKIEDYSRFFKKIINFYRNNEQVLKNRNLNFDQSKYDKFVDELNDYLKLHSISLPFKQYSNNIKIKYFTNEFTQFSSISKPIKINFVSEIGGKDENFSLILKKDSSSAREVMTANILDQFNNLYSKSTDYEMKLYNIFQLDHEVLLVEFVNEIYPLRPVAEEMTSLYGDLNWEFFNEEEIFKKNYLYSYFIRINNDPNRYFSHKMNYIRSYATSSIACQLIGLGDRHTSNIFFYNDGTILNIDYGYSLHTSLYLPCPEIILLRLTHNLTFAFGLFKENGPFFSYSLKALNTFKKYSKVISIIFNSYLNNIANDSDLKGNLQNTYQQAMKLLSGVSYDELTNLIARCTDSSNIVRMYFGWTPGF